MKKIDEKTKELIIQDYLKGDLIKNICKKYNVNKNYPTELIKKNNIPLRGSGYKLNTFIHKFKMNTEERNYWIGYIIADGSITYNTYTRQYRVSIYTIDKETKERFKIYSNCNVYTTDKGYLLYIDSKELIMYLINNLNIIPNKTKVIDPNIEINWDLFRGIFDGDGTIRKDRNDFKITSSSYRLMCILSSFLNKNNITNKIKKRKNQDVYDLTVFNRDNITKLFNKMYYNSHYLTRKYDRFVALVGDH